MFHSSGRWFFGSHCPYWSRKLKMRSLARAFSSSRRAPPKTASWRPSVMARRRVGVCRRLRVAPGDVSSTVRPASMSSCTRATSRRTPARGDVAVPELEHLGEVAAGVDVHDREGHRGRPEGLLGQVQHDDGVLAAREEQHGALELRRHLTEDVDRLGLERAEVRQAVAPGSAARRALLLAGVAHHTWCRQRTVSSLSPLVPLRPRRSLRPRLGGACAGLLGCRRRCRWPRPPGCRSGCRRRPRPSGQLRASWRRWRSRRGPR